MQNPLTFHDRRVRVQSGRTQPAVRARKGYGECVLIVSLVPFTDGEDIGNADTGGLFAAMKDLGHA